jgi:hypothetical protein
MKFILARHVGTGKGDFEKGDSSPIYPIFEKVLILLTSIYMKWDELPESNEERGAKQSFLMIMTKDFRETFRR